MKKWMVWIPCLIGCGGSADVRPPAAKNTAVEIVVAKSEDVSRPIKASGTVRAKRAVELSFKGAGVVDRVFVDEGARVKKGQVLARLDATEYQMGASQAKDSFDKAARDFERAKKLEERGAIGRMETEDAKTRFDVARAGLTQAAYNVTRAQIVAPEDGWILRRFVETGEVASPGRPVLQFEGGLRGKVVRVSLVDREAMSLELATACDVRIDARPDLALKGVVSEIGRDVSKVTGLVDVEVKFEGGENMPDGLSAKISCAPRATTALVLPIESLLGENGAHASVFSLDDQNVAHRQEIVTGDARENKVIVKDGLKEGTRIVTRGAAYVHEGEKVQLASLNEAEHAPSDTAVVIR